MSQRRVLSISAVENTFSKGKMRLDVEPQIFRLRRYGVEKGDKNYCKIVISENHGGEIPPLGARMSIAEKNSTPKIPPLGATPDENTDTVRVPPSPVGVGWGGLGCVRTSGAFASGGLGLVGTSRGEHSAI